MWLFWFDFTGLTGGFSSKNLPGIPEYWDHHWIGPPPTVDGMQHRASPLLFLLCSPKQSLPPFHLPRLLFITRETMRLEEAGAHFNQILPPPPPFCQLAPCRRSNHKNCVMDAGWGLLLPKEEGIKSRTQDDRWVGEEEISSEEMKCRVDWSVSQSHSSLRFGGGGGFWGLQRDDGGDQSVSGRRTFASCRAAEGSFPRGVREVKLRNLIILDGL